MNYYQIHAVTFLFEGAGSAHGLILGSLGDLKKGCENYIKNHDELWGTDSFFGSLQVDRNGGKSNTWFCEALSKKRWKA